MIHIFKSVITLCAIGISSTPAIAQGSENIGVAVQGGQFVTREGVIPAGCFAQLITEMNGDNSVASVFIHSASLRGCMDANYPYPGGDEDKVRYSIEEEVNPNLFALKVCVTAEGSMGGTCGKILVDFNYRNYLIDSGVRTVLTLNKIGEW